MICISTTSCTIDLTDPLLNTALLHSQVKPDSKDGKGTWDRITNVNIIGVEFAVNLKGILDNWNIQTSNWLRYTMYERSSSAAVMKTMMLSALWHGTYPGKESG